jgi:hypothetical protein
MSCSSSGPRLPDEMRAGKDFVASFQAPVGCTCSRYRRSRARAEDVEARRARVHVGARGVAVELLRLRHRLRFACR